MFYGSMPTAPWGTHKNDKVSSTALAAKSAVQHLQYEVERLLMINEALWDILKEKFGYEDSELIKRVVDIDMKDGFLDGKVRKTGATECEKCGRKIKKKHIRCLYCGAPNKAELFSR